MVGSCETAHLPRLPLPLVSASSRLVLRRLKEEKGERERERGEAEGKEGKKEIKRLEGGSF